MSNDAVARKLLIEQTRRELLNEIKQYYMGLFRSGTLMVKKNTSLESGRIFIIPDNKYEELFNE